MTWHTEPMLALDTETSGIDIESDRIVSAAVIHVSREGAKPTTWLSDVGGMEIPEAATAVHGITTEHARAHGTPAKEVIEDVLYALGEAVNAGLPIVGHNVVYDLSLIDREARRHLGCGLDGALPLPKLRVIDTRVLDQHVLPRRRRVSKDQGPRQLITVARVYSLPWDEEAAHGSEYDALMAARVAYRIGSLIEMPREQRPQFELGKFQQFDQLRGLDLDALHAKQIEMAAEQAAGLQDYFRQKDPNAVVDGRWPVIPFEGGERLMFIGSLIALGVVAVLAVTAVCAGHIPGLDRWTGAAPLLAAEPDADAYLPCHTTTCGHMTTPHDRTPAGLVCRGCGNTTLEVTP